MTWHPRLFPCTFTAALVALSFACDSGKTQKLVAQSNPGFRSDYKRLVRWSLPIQVNTSGIARAEEAVDNVARLTNGAVRFERVSVMPENGIVFLDGGGMNGDGSPGCGHVSGGAPGQLAVNFQHDDQGRLKGVYYVHLGSSRCADSTRGSRRSTVAEHELAHALGVATHFENFTGNEGVEPPEIRAVITMIYQNPAGTALADLKAAGGR